MDENLRDLVFFPIRPKSSFSVVSWGSLEVVWPPPLTYCLPVSSYPFTILVLSIFRAGGIFKSEIFNHFSRSDYSFQHRCINRPPPHFCLLSSYYFAFSFTMTCCRRIWNQQSSTGKHITPKARPSLICVFIPFYYPQWMSWQEEMTETYHLKTPSTEF